MFLNENNYNYVRMNDQYRCFGTYISCFFQNNYYYMQTHYDKYFDIALILKRHISIHQFLHFVHFSIKSRICIEWRFIYMIIFFQKHIEYRHKNINVKLIVYGNVHSNVFRLKCHYNYIYFTLTENGCISIPIEKV